MRSALVNAEAGPQPEDERTVLIPRPGVPPAGTVDPQRPAILVSVVSRPTEFDEAVVKLEAPLPRTQGLQLKKEIAAGARAAPAVTKRATGARRATTADGAPRAVQEMGPYRQYSRRAGHRRGCRNSMADRGAPERAGTRAARN